MLPKISSIRHTAYCCPTCNGPVKFTALDINPTMSGLLCVCSYCTWTPPNAVASGNEEIAIATWNAGVKAQLKTRGRPSALPIGDDARVEFSARVQGWIDFELSAGDNNLWYLDAGDAPFGRSIQKLLWDPLNNQEQAQSLAAALNLELTYQHGYVAVTCRKLVAAGRKSVVHYDAMFPTRRATEAAKAMNRAIVDAAARYYQLGLHQTRDA